MILEREAALVIREITNTSIEIAEEAEAVDMCKAIEEMMMEREERGIEKGELRMLAKQVKKGRLTISEAAEDAGMPLEQLTNVLKSSTLYIGEPEKRPQF